jgi:hypothetical protein
MLLFDQQLEKKKPMLNQHSLNSLDCFLSNDIVSLLYQENEQFDDENVQFIDSFLRFKFFSFNISQQEHSFENTETKQSLLFYKKYSLFIRQLSSQCLTMFSNNNFDFDKNLQGLMSKDLKLIELTRKWKQCIIENENNVNENDEKYRIDLHCFLLFSLALIDNLLASFVKHLVSIVYFFIIDN